MGMKYNKGGSNPQGQVQLILQRADGTFEEKRGLFKVPFKASTALFLDETALVPDANHCPPPARPSHRPGVRWRCLTPMNWTPATRRE